MFPPTHPRHVTHSRRVPSAAGGVEVQLPWWAIALPALAFAALLLLIVGPADAGAREGGQGSGTLSQVVTVIRQAVL